VHSFAGSEAEEAYTNLKYIYAILMKNTVRRHLMIIKHKIWIEDKGQKAFGLGPLELLEAVNKMGSLKKGAESINMSYNKAWNLIKKLEKVNGFKILEKQVGGQGGGKSKITPEAYVLMEKFQKFHKEVDLMIEEKYHAFF